MSTTFYSYHLAPKIERYEGDRILFLRRFFSYWLNGAMLLLLSFMIVFALWGQHLSPWQPDQVDYLALADIKNLGAPSLLTGHYFGVDASGMDVFSRLVLASRTSLGFALLAAIASVILGAFSGVIAGYYGGWIDIIMLWMNELAQSIPFIVLIVLWQAYLGNATLQTLLVIVLITWPKMFMLARGQTMMLKNKEYILAAKIMDLSDAVIIWRHILPNMMGIFFVGLSLMLPTIVGIESLISFLNLGPDSSYANWGTLLAEGVRFMWSESVWLFIFTAVIYALAQISFFFLAEGLRSALDPKGLK